MQQKIGLAKSAYEQAIKLNPRIDVQKDLGWINLALKDYPAAISLLSDHLHRNPLATSGLASVPSSPSRTQPPPHLAFAFKNAHSASAICRYPRLLG